MSEEEPKPVFKKRAARPQPRKRPTEDPPDEVSTPREEREGSEGAEDEKLSVEELMELRKLRRQKQGIDSTKLNAGVIKKKKKLEEEEEPEVDKYGLRLANKPAVKEEDEVDPDDSEAVARKLIRSNNFTQQTNKLDVDKHMMKYIEEELEKRRGNSGSNSAPGGSKSSDPYDELFRISEKYKIEKREQEEGSVTNSTAMLTAIPEVDLGMDTRLKNIEETEKAKRTVSENRKGNRGPRDVNDEQHLAASRFFNPHLKVQSDADAMRNAKLEAMGLPPEMDTRGYIKERDNRRDVATDEQVMERFKKRMRK
ncbi:hypothetical protein BDV93DRAFT_603339 [Ceratobasidium sp. AG-I]|nr:hypothetical protein BDV93DRAFT_603339 [Ceratobasidium sp. AG-I]